MHTKSPRASSIMANFLLCFTLLLVILQIAVSQESEDYKNCSTKRNILLKALFNTGRNLFELDKVFFPPRSQTSRYIKVKYTFLNDNGTDDGNCTVNYIWAIGGFLLVQPPTIFQFTSLYFSTPANKLEDLTLQLPSACKGLVYNETFDNCSCASGNRHALDRLTQQVRCAFTLFKASCALAIPRPRAVGLVILVPPSPIVQRKRSFPSHIILGKGRGI